MKIKKIGHSCLVIEINGNRIMTDPGNFSVGQTEEENIDIILITHEHRDHYDPDILKVIMGKNPHVRIVTNEAVALKLSEAGISAEIVSDGAKLKINEISIDVYGKDHAVIYKNVPLIYNVGFLIDKKLYHPGDALYDPEVPVEILALPVAAPWLKISEAIEYALKIKPRVAFPIHDGHIKPVGYGAIRNLPQSMLEAEQISFVDINEENEVDI